jgi:pimeloyl-ACP methyl ester carboxylesterase
MCAAAMGDPQIVFTHSFGAWSEHWDDVLDVLGGRVASLTPSTGWPLGSS